MVQGMDIIRLITAGIVFLLTFVIEGTAQVHLRYDSSVQVFENDILLENAWSGGLNAGQFSRIDMNADGQEDLVVYDRSSNLFHTYLKINDSFIYHPAYRDFFPEDIEGWIVFRDYDCDGRKDIFANTERGMKAYRNISPPGGPLSWELVADPVLSLTNSGLINLQVNITDLPAIDDVDGDGDLDILVYNFAIGGYIRHHKNMSVERTGSCGSLDFELVSRNWGYFEECDCNWYAFLEFGETCSDPPPLGRVMHPGGKSLTLIDMDNDGDKDFLGGHEQCDELYYLENVGTPEEAKMTYFVDTFPNPGKPANFHIHPAAYFEDFDFDGVKDLLVAPNEQYNIDYAIDFAHSAWFYKNTGTNELPDFSFVTKRFLQSTMIDLGDNAVPSLVDIDGDGDLDLIIGGNGKQSEDIFYGYIRMYVNTGDALNPVFEMADNDYLGLSSLKNINLMPVFADLNHDGAVDLAVTAMDPDNGDIQTRWYVNSNRPGRGLAFDTNEFEMLDLDIRNFDTPLFTDVNKDGLVDLLVGKSTGRLAYYMNIGNDEQPFFTLEEAAFLGIDDDFITFRRNLVPFVIDLDLDGQDDLLTTDYTGDLILYKHYQNDPEKVYNILRKPMTDQLDTAMLGYQSWLTGGALFADEYPVVLAGTISGGLLFYRNISHQGNGDTSELSLKVYPNPLEKGNMLNLLANDDGRVIMYNALGQQLENPVSVEAYRLIQIDIARLTQGMYLLKLVNSSGSSQTQRLIKY